MFFAENQVRSKREWNLGSTRASDLTGADPLPRRLVEPPTAAESRNDVRENHFSAASASPKPAGGAYLAASPKPLKRAGDSPSWNPSNYP